MREIKFTGFKDYKRQKMNDGDIIKRIDTGDIFLIEWRNVSWRSTKIYDHWSEIFLPHRNESGDLSIMAKFQIEVIGNKRENPELLKS